MADRYDMDRYDAERERDRERRGERDWDRNRQWDRGRDWGRDVGGDRFAGRSGENWDWDRRSEYSGEAPRGGHEGQRWDNPNRRDDDRERRWAGGWREGNPRNERDWDRESGFGPRGGDEGWRGNRYSGSERSADWGSRGDWGSQGRWGSYGNRADYGREDPALRSGRIESDWGGARTNRTNLFGTGGGGFGTGMASYGAGMGNFEGTATYGGGMGRHAGRGPKGWQRSDDRIREDVNERLTDHPHIDASEIQVQVNNGEVTLTGTVDDRPSKRLAEDIAESVSGVREVHNNIRIQQREIARQGSSQGSPQRGSASTETRSK